MTPFEENIKSYLDARVAAGDTVLADKLANPKKSIEECCRYICEEVRKTGRQGFADAEIYGMAIHYYDEDDMKVAEKVDCKVVINKEIQLTEEEKAKIAEEAKSRLKEEEMGRQMQKLRSEQEKAAKKKEEAEKKRKEEEKEGMLFLF